MNTHFDQALQSIDQTAVADDLASFLTAVVSDTTSPDSALAGLHKAREAAGGPEQRAAVAALQAYGVEYAAGVLSAGLERDAGERAARLHEALEADAEGDALAVLRGDDEPGSQFKSRLALKIASRCAEMIAAEIERDKQGHFTILDEKDAAIFESRRAAHREQRIEAAREFLASLPVRYPSFGASLFADIRRHVEQEVAEHHKRPDIHEAVASLFDTALERMSGPTRDAVARARS